MFITTCLCISDIMHPWIQVGFCLIMYIVHVGIELNVNNHTLIISKYVLVDNFY